MPSAWPRNVLAKANAVAGRCAGFFASADITTPATRFGIFFECSRRCCGDCSRCAFMTAEVLPPFSGNTSAVMKAHREQSPQHLREHSKKIPKRVAGVVMSALAKNPAQRPATAFAFASTLRGQAEGIGALYRRAFSLYSEFFPKFVKLSFIAHIPVIVTSILMSALLIADRYLSGGNKAVKIALLCVTALVALVQVLAYLMTSSVISGVTAV